MLTLGNFYGTRSYNVKHSYKKKKERYKLHGLSPRANYTDRATSVCKT
jgi:hypothetical protein